jgi:hypothetical protein
VILEPELGGGYGVADLVVGRCLIEVKTAYDPAAAMSVWLSQVLAYALLDWSDALGVNTVAVYLGWQALLVSESLTRVLAAATTGTTPSLEDLRADFHRSMQADIDEAFAIRMRQRYPLFITPAPQVSGTLLSREHLHAMYRSFAWLGRNWSDIRRSELFESLRLSYQAWRNLGT